MIEDHEINRQGWNKRTDAHLNHPGQRVAEFLAGKTSLHPLELEEVGDVGGKKLLHLQCHFGLDTLSWARLGAEVTGIDISDRSIAVARELASKIGVAARFIRTDLFDLPEHLAETFDIVYTSYGATWWMSDIIRWAEVAARYVAKGGFFYIAEIHPVLCMLDARKQIIEPYFHQGAERSFDEVDYIDRSVTIEQECGWRWTLGDVITALARAGLRIEYLHEFPYCVYDTYPETFVQDGRWYYYPDRKNDVPMTYSIRACK
jgi:SAM-dependent methyltransferase